MRIGWRLRAYPEAYAANLEAHFLRHLKPFVEEMRDIPYSPQEVELTAQDLRELDEIAPMGAASGPRYTEMGMALVDR